MNLEEIGPQSGMSVVEWGAALLPFLSVGGGEESVETNLEPWPPGGVKKQGVASPGSCQALVPWFPTPQSAVFRVPCSLLLHSVVPFPKDLPALCHP